MALSRLFLLSFGLLISVQGQANNFRDLMIRDRTTKAVVENKLNQMLNVANLEITDYQSTINGLTKESLFDTSSTANLRRDLHFKFTDIKTRQTHSFVCEVTIKKPQDQYSKGNMQVRECSGQGRNIGEFLKNPPSPKQTEISFQLNSVIQPIPDVRRFPGGTN